MNAPRRRSGAGQVSAVAFAVPQGSLDYWRRRLRDKGVRIEDETARFGERVLCFADPDGLALELAERSAAAEALPHGAVPARHSIIGFRGVTLSLHEIGDTARLLEEIFGFEARGREDGRTRYVSPSDRFAAAIDLAAAPGAGRGAAAAGTVHHVACRTPDDRQHEAWRARLVRHGYMVTPVVDRLYFRSIYFREPGGVLFEIATEPPGFAIDEPADELGGGLMLPAWLEESRALLERTLPPLRLHKRTLKAGNE